MATHRSDAINALLIQAEQAHGDYERTVLNGAYDKDWPHWYAAHAIEHGIGAFVDGDITTETLAAFLASTYAEFERTDPRPAEPWSVHIARRIATEL